MEIIHDNTSHAFLRIITQEIQNDQLNNLSSVAHMHDHNVNSWYTGYNDWDYVNRTYETLWLCTDKSFYDQQRKWINVARKNFNGKLINFFLDPEFLCNVDFDYSSRYGYVKGKTVKLTGKDRSDVRDYAKMVNLDVGLICFHGDKPIILTDWNLNLTGTRKEAKRSAEFLHLILEYIGVSPYWNTVDPRQIMKVVQYTSGIYSFDNYEDRGPSSLIITEPYSTFASQLQCLIRSKNLTSIKLYTSDSPEDLNLQLYETIYFIVGDLWSLRHSIFLEKLKQEYQGKLINFSCLYDLTRDIVHNNWEENDIFCARYVRGFGYTIPEKATIPFGPPYIIRSTFGHAGQSNMVEMMDYDYIRSWPWWTWGQHYADFIIQEKIDVSVEGTYDLGRIAWVKDKLFPLYAIRGTNWMVRPERSSTILRSMNEDCFSEVIRGFDDIPGFNKQIQNIIKATKIDVGSMDFSVKEGKIIPWDVTIKWGHELVNHWQERSSNSITCIINAVLKELNNPLEISTDETRTILEEAAMETKAWNLTTNR